MLKTVYIVCCFSKNVLFMHCILHIWNQRCMGVPYVHYCNGSLIVTALLTCFEEPIFNWFNNTFDLFVFLLGLNTFNFNWFKNTSDSFFIYLLLTTYMFWYKIIINNNFFFERTFNNTAGQPIVMVYGSSIYLVG
jgi:hypothetical protein